MLKQTILSKGFDTNIIINLGSDTNFLGTSEGINTYVDSKTLSSVNSNNDLEKIKFKHLNSSYNNVEIDFYFINFITLIGYVRALPINFDSVTYHRETLQNSFFIMDFYDSYDTQIQNKITTSYLTLIQNQYSIYNITLTGSARQFYYNYVPTNFINNFTGNTVTGYTKFSFYNAQTGKIQLFYNLYNSGLTTNEKMYFKTILNLTNNSFYFTGLGILKAYEFISGQYYIDKMNTNITNTNIYQPVYPSGNTFNNLTGKYEIIK